MSGALPFHRLLSGSSKDLPFDMAWPSGLIFKVLTDPSILSTIAFPSKALGSNRLVPGIIGPKAIGRDGLSFVVSPAI